MKRAFLFGLLSILFLLPAHSQILKPVKWETSSEHISGDEFNLIFKATIKDGWTIYSQYLESDDGPEPTTFTFDEEPHFSLVGKNKESDKNRKSGFDKIFEMNVVKYSKEAIFTQKVKATELDKAITGYLTFMTCDDTKCLPPTDVDFEFKLEKSETKASSSSAENSSSPKTTQEKDKVESKSSIQVNVENQNTGGPIKKPSIVVESKNEKGAVTNTEIAISQPKVKSNTSANSNNNQSQDQDENEPEQKSGLLEPVKWKIGIDKLTEEEFEITYTAQIDEGWTIYSQHTNDDGPIPTSFEFDSADHFELIGETSEEGKKKEGFDKFFETQVIKFIKGPVYFKQKIKTADPNMAVSGFLTFMTCDDSKCLPPADVDFVVMPGQSTALIGDEARALISSLKGEEDTASDGQQINKGPYPLEATNVDLTNPVHDCENVVQIEKASSIWRIFILGFLGGLVALLTPCVFPMIPLTVSFFTKGASDRKKGIMNAFLYGFFILMVYVILSVPFHLMDSISGDILNDISTNVWLNIAFFLIFLFFAFSFFGYYEITLPESWTNKSSSAEGAGGLLGIFFMALTLALVSFSCTGPILGSLLAGALSSDGGAWQLTSGMGGFGLALALPFGLFAAFPSIMSALPKSGGWLNTVKVVLGFVELALAFKFLSNADLVKHWGLLKVEPFLIIWILCSIGLAAYLFGWLKFPHDSPLKKLKPGRVLFGSIWVVLAVYLATGLFHDKEKDTLRSLSLLSGIAPPTCYSLLYPCDCPNNLTCFKDMESGLSYAKKHNKPIMIDFTGYACVNCRKMEEHVWPKKSIFKLLDKNYVLISLYVDDKKELPEKLEVPRVQGNGNRKLRNYGHKWAHFQEKYFATNTQPYYALLSPDLELLNSPVGYTPEVKEYEQFLQCGLDAFEELQQSKTRLGSR